MIIHNESMAVKTHEIDGQKGRKKWKEEDRLQTSQIQYAKHIFYVQEKSCLTRLGSKEVTSL